MTEQEIQKLEQKHHAECIDDASRNNLPISDSQVKRFTAQGLTLVQLYEILILRKSIESSIDEWFELLETNGIIKNVPAWQPSVREYSSVFVPTMDSLKKDFFKPSSGIFLTPKGVLEVMNLI